MPKRPVDNSALERWRTLDATKVLRAVAEHVVEDRTFKPTKSQGTTRWHASAGGVDFELLCAGPKFFDTRANLGGGGAVDLVMHLLTVDFVKAAQLLTAKGL